MSTVEFARDPDSDARTGTDCHNLADNFYTVSLGQTGQHIKIGMTKYGTYSTSVSYLGVTCQ